MSQSSRTRRVTARLGAVVLALAALGVAASASPSPAVAADGPVRSTTEGPVQGLVQGGTAQFRGLPYAAAPVGDLRWRPPQPVAAHSGVRDATSFAPHCAQGASPYGRPSTAEDCLYLNVTAPAGAAAGADLPVMVWVHGGALVVGESDDYDATGLVRDGAVVVTINYRLGALGFLAHPALSAEEGGSSGDYGLMDQQEALRWVQANIAGFGGDAGKVTIFGESAGGLSVLSQVASPSAAGLFSRAVSESGAYALDQVSQATADGAGERFAAAAGCADQSAACLRALPVGQVLAKQNGGLGYQPNVDGKVLPQTISAALASGQFNRVPLVNGSNRDEWRLFVAANDLAGAPLTAATYQPAISATLGVDSATAAVIAARYPLSRYPSADVALGALGTDAIFACNARKVDQLASQHVPTYAYEFADRHAPQRFLPQVSYPYGAYHAAEVQYLFDISSPRPGGLGSRQQELADTMKQYWTGFAATGEPNGTGATPAWPVWTSSTQQDLQLVPSGPTVSRSFAARHQCGFWTPGT